MTYLVLGYAVTAVVLVWRAVSLHGRVKRTRERLRAMGPAAARRP